MKQGNSRVEALISIVAKEYQPLLTEAINETSSALHFSGVGHGTASSSYTSYFGFNDIEKRIVLSLIPKSDAPRVLAAVNRRLKLYLLGRGIAFTLPLSAISSLVSGAILTGEKAETNEPKKETRSMHELVIATVNQKYTDVTIDAARRAGATGATVFHTRSTDSARFEQNLGTSLPTETDTVFIITSVDNKKRIFESIRDAAGLKTDGSAVLFSLPIDDLVGMGRFGETGEA